MIDQAIVEQAEEVSQLLKQLAHPDRLRVLCYLIDGPKTVTELVHFTGASQSWVSQFLSRMKETGLVISEKQGVYVRYQLGDKRLKKLMKSIHDLYCSKS